MRPTDTFRQHHAEILDIAGEISGLLTEPEVQKEASRITQLLARFAGKLKGHLAMEDKVLYPKLLNHDDPHINHMASRFMNEMGGISETVVAYCGQWSTPAAISGDARTFITETKRLFRALEKRIDREDNVLYPALDKVS